MPNRTSFDITYTSLIRVAIVLTIFVALFEVGKVILALLFAVVVASAIEPGVRWLKRYRVPRILAVLLIYLVAIGILAGTLSLIVPVVVDEFSAFLDSFPRYQRVLLQELRSFQNLPFYSLFSDNAEDIILNPPFDLRSSGAGALDFLFSIFGGIFSGVILIVVSFYLACQENGIERFLRLITPLRHEEYIIDLWTRSQVKMGYWLRGQILLGLIMGVFVYIALTLLGVRYAAILALLAAIFEIIPTVGPILAAVPAVFLGFLSSPLLGLIVGVVYFILQQTENHLLVPLVLQRSIGLNPLAVIIALLIGAQLGGILGLFLSVPLASIVVELVTDIDKRKRGGFQLGGGSAS